MIKDLTTGRPGSYYGDFRFLCYRGDFQQVYNIADSVIAGKFAGEDALAAVGASYPITMIFMAVAIGCQIGCTIIGQPAFWGKAVRKPEIRSFHSYYQRLCAVCAADGIGDFRFRRYDEAGQYTGKYFCRR